MDWFVISPVNGIESWPDNATGKDKALQFVEHELSYYAGNGYKPKDYYIFRGERHEYIPPSGKPQLVEMKKR